MAHKTGSMISKIIQASEAAALQRYINGDLSSRILQFQSSWLLDQLGAAIDSDQRLANIERLALDAGNLRSHATKERFRWIRTGEELREKFFSHLMQTNGGTWDELVAAYELVVNELSPYWAHLFKDVPKMPEIGLSDVDLNDLRELNADLADSVNRGRRLINSIAEEAWLPAFASGRILVFKRVGERYEFRPPPDWQAAPPIALNMTVAELDQELRDKAKPNYESKSGLSAVFRQSGLRTIPTALSVLRPITPPAGIISKPILPQANTRGFVFLLSGDLPHEAFKHGARPPNRKELNRILEARKWLRGRILTARVAGSRFSCADTVAELRERWSIGKTQAKHIFNTQRPELWNRAGPIPVAEKFDLSNA